MVENTIELANQIASCCTGRDALVNRYISSIKNKRTDLFLLRGDSGSGKSTILAGIREELKKENNILWIDCASSPRTLTATDLLKDIVYQLELLLGVGGHYEEYLEEDVDMGKTKRNMFFERDSEIIASMWKEKFDEYVTLYDERAEKPLYIMCDSLESLHIDNVFKRYLKMPIMMPEKVTIVASANSSWKLLPSTEYKVRSTRTVIEEIHMEASEAREIIKVIANEKELPQIVVDAIIDNKGAINPLFINLATKRTMMSDNEEDVLELVQSFPITATEMSKLLFDKVTQDINCEFQYEVFQLIANSRKGISKVDLRAIIEMQGLEWSDDAFAKLMKSTKGLMIQDEGMRVDFTHQIIREGVLEKEEAKNYKNRIFEYLSSQEEETADTIAEITWCAYQLNDKMILSQYIGKMIRNKNKELLSVISTELKKIAEKDNQWVVEIIGVDENQDTLVMSFINELLYEEFKESKSLCEKMKSVLENMLLEIDEVERTEKLIMCHNWLCGICIKMNKVEEAKEHFEIGDRLRAEKWESYLQQECEDNDSEKTSIIQKAKDIFRKAREIKIFDIEGTDKSKRVCEIIRMLLNILWLPSGYFVLYILFLGIEYGAYEQIIDADYHKWVILTIIVIYFSYLTNEIGCMVGAVIQGADVSKMSALIIRGIPVVDFEWGENVNFSREKRIWTLLVGIKVNFVMAGITAVSCIAYQSNMLYTFSIIQLFYGVMRLAFGNIFSDTSIVEQIIGAQASWKTVTNVWNDQTFITSKVNHVIITIVICCVKMLKWWWGILLSVWIIVSKVSLRFWHPQVTVEFMQHIFLAFCLLVVIFYCIYYIRLCKGVETVWLYLSGLVVTIPVNYYIFDHIIVIGGIIEEYLIYRVPLILLLCILLCQLEAMVIAFVGMKVCGEKNSFINAEMFTIYECDGEEYLQLYSTEHNGREYILLVNELDKSDFFLQRIVSESETESLETEREVRVVLRLMKIEGPREVKKLISKSNVFEA